MELIATPGQDHDITQASNLLADHSPRHVIADKGYDSNDLLTEIRSRDSIPVIPARAGRTVTRRLLRGLYRQRNVIERFVNRIKHYRRVATRYDKTARNFLAFAQFVSALIWIT